MGMNKTLLSLIAASVISAACSSSVLANESQEYHDADPRNSNFRAAVFASDAGELKLLAGGGASGLTSDISQTIGFAEYYTQSNNARIRAAHFDRFGGAYMDLYRLDDAAGMYTAGYMLPLESDDGTLFFPSLNYTYIDFKTADLSELANSAIAGSPLGGLSVTKNDIQQTLQGNDAHLGSVNLYAVHPWNETHFSVFNVNLGSSYSGVDMQVANIMWVQGIKTHVADKTINIMLEVKYDAMKIQTDQNTNLSSDGEERSEEVTVSVGVDYRF
ncbi:hypothetical protein [Moritella marina]|uniref:hypothetical protein n=1 Tax=Moritella marina TaxID=90736 RepID=UPI003703AAD1